MADREADRRVLLVEDDRDVRHALSRVLEFEGYRVASATNGREAIERLRIGPRPDLILLDLMMPVMDGVQFRAAQLGDPAIAAIPVVIVSADSRVERQAVALGVSGWLRKPIDVEMLLEVVARHCGS